MATKYERTPAYTLLNAEERDRFGGHSSSPTPYFVTSPPPSVSGDDAAEGFSGMAAARSPTSYGFALSGAPPPLALSSPARIANARYEHRVDGQTTVTSAMRDENAYARHFAALPAPPLPSNPPPSAYNFAPPPFATHFIGRHPPPQPPHQSFGFAAAPIAYYSLPVSFVFWDANFFVSNFSRRLFSPIRRQWPPPPSTRRLLAPSARPASNAAAAIARAAEAAAAAAAAAATARVIIIAADRFFCLHLLVINRSLVSTNSRAETLRNARASPIYDANPLALAPPMRTKICSIGGGDCKLAAAIEKTRPLLELQPAFAIDKPKIERCGAPPCRARARSSSL